MIRTPNSATTCTTSRYLTDTYTAMDNRFAIAGAAGAALILFARWRKGQQQRHNAASATIANDDDCDAADHDGVVPDDATSDLIFLGTGSSAGTPFLQCLLGLLPSRPDLGLVEGRIGGCHARHDSDTTIYAQRRAGLILTAVQFFLTHRYAPAPTTPR